MAALFLQKLLPQLFLGSLSPWIWSCLPLSAEEAHLSGLPAPSPFYGPFAKTREAQGTFLSIQRLQERTGKRRGDCQKAAMHHRHLVRIWIKGRLNQMPLLCHTQDPCLSRTILERSASWKWAEYLGGLRGCPGPWGSTMVLALGFWVPAWPLGWHFTGQGRWALQGSRVAMASSRFLTLPLLPCLVSQRWDCQSCQLCIFQDWSKLPIYEQPGANALQRRKDRVELLREAEPGSASLIYPGLSLEDGPRPRLSPASIAAKVRPGPRKRPWATSAGLGVHLELYLGHCLNVP